MKAYLNKFKAPMAGGTESRKMNLNVEGNGKCIARY